MSTTLKIVVLLFFAVLFRVLGGLLGEVAAIVCFLAAISIGALAWQRRHPRTEEQLNDDEAYRIEENKLASYGLSDELSS